MMNSKGPIIQGRIFVDLFIALFQQIVQLADGQFPQGNLACAGRPYHHGLDHGFRINRRYLGSCTGNLEFKQDFTHEAICGLLRKSL